MSGLRDGWKMRATGLSNSFEMEEAGFADSGCFYARHPLFPAARCAEVLVDAVAFFDQPNEGKQALAIEHSPHFRGYSEMRNERDWREQIHFGREEAAAGEGPSYEQLRGPNMWPSVAAWRARTMALLADLEVAGRDILAELAVRLGLPAVHFLAGDEVPYLLLKMILYQVPPSGTPRSGVAPHVDFSWITLLLQDDTGGLEVCTGAGDWLEVPPKPGWLVVNVGEILEFASRGHYRATPHRVVNRSRARVSLPFFLNPGLASTVERAPVEAAADREADRTHVHRLFPGTRREGFVFGEQEWRRKGLGIWCSTCVSG